MSTATKKPKGWLIAGIVLLFLSLGGCTAAVSGIASLGGGVDEVMSPTPFGGTAEFTAATDSGALVVMTDAGECTGEDGSGRALTFETPISNVPTEADGQSLEFARTFDTAQGQTYRLVCGTSGADAEFTVLRVPDFPFGIPGLLASLFGGIIVGVLGLLLGVIFLIIGLVKRARGKGPRDGSGPSAPAVADDDHDGTAPPPPPPT